MPNDLPPMTDIDAPAPPRRPLAVPPPPSLLLDGKKLDLTRRLYARDLTHDEFDGFIEICRHAGLNPYLKQIIAVVFNKDDEDKRQFVPIITRVGSRIMANRWGNYLPPIEPPEFVFDENRKSRANPQGLVSCSVKVRQVHRFANGPSEVFEILGVAYWDMVAPVRPAGEWRTNEQGKRRFKRLYDDDNQPILELDPRNEFWKGDGALHMLKKCFDDRTEVLTTNGFELFSQVTGEILQVLDNDQLCPTLARPFNQRYEGLMVTLDSGVLDFSVTPDHDMITTTGKTCARHLYDVSRTRAHHHIPRCLSTSTKDLDITDDKIKLAAIYLCDGSDHQTANAFTVKISRKRKVDILNEINLHQSKRLENTQGQIAHIGDREIITKTNHTSFYYRFEQIAVLMKRGKRSRTEWLTLLSQRQARLFIDTMIKFDGHTQKKTGVRRFYSSNVHILAVFELVAVVAGYSVSNRKQRVGDSWVRPNYYVTISDRNQIPIRRWGRGEDRRSKQNETNRTGLKLTHYDGDVWCVTVSSGEIIVRRNGFSMRCGNCAEVDALRAGWPEQMGGLYHEDEMHRAKVIDATATEIIQEEQEQVRAALLGGLDQVLIVWPGQEEPEMIPAGKMYDRCDQFITRCNDRSTLEKWFAINKGALNAFWIRHKTDALAIRQLHEMRIDALKEQEQQASPELALS